MYNKVSKNVNSVNFYQNGYKFREKRGVGGCHSADDLWRMHASSLSPSQENTERNTKMDELQKARTEINEIDEQIVELFKQRMNIAAGVAAYKKAHDLPVLDAARERA